MKNGKPRSPSIYDWPAWRTISHCRQCRPVRERHARRRDTDTEGTDGIGITTITIIGERIVKVNQVSLSLASLHHSVNALQAPVSLFSNRTSSFLTTRFRHRQHHSLSIVCVRTFAHSSLRPPLPTTVPIIAPLTQSTSTTAIVRRSPPGISHSCSPLARTSTPTSSKRGSCPRRTPRSSSCR